MSGALGRRLDPLGLISEPFDETVARLQQQEMRSSVQQQMFGRLAKHCDRRCNAVFIVSVIVPVNACVCVHVLRVVVLPGPLP